MLKQRIITALALVGLLVAALAIDNPLPFALVTLFLTAAAGWEWVSLNQGGKVVSVLLGIVVAAVGLPALLAGWKTEAPVGLWWLAVALWGVGGFFALHSGPAAWPSLPKPVRWTLGLVALCLTWLALLQARAIGINYLLSVFCLVWMADVAAYFGGRAFGKRKLAPSISPGKSWEGVWSGMLGVLLLALLWMWLDSRFAFDSDSVFTRLQHSLGWLLCAIALLALCGLSVVGDLLESLVKRAAGAKDSSRLLPGHGGVLDRIDALLPVLPAAMALITLGAG